MALNELITRKHIDSFAQQLAEAAGITPQQANKVLEVLHIHKLNENIVALHEILQNEKAVNALGMSHAAAKARLTAISPDNLTLADMRIGFKKPGDIAGVHPV